MSHYVNQNLQKLAPKGLTLYKIRDGSSDPLHKLSLSRLHLSVILTPPLNSYQRHSAIVLQDFPAVTMSDLPDGRSILEWLLLDILTSVMETMGRARGRRRELKYGTTIHRTLRLRKYMKVRSILWLQFVS
jgi:hypothetical protein